MFRARNKKHLLTLHGINSRGEWHELVARAMRHFFNCERITYPEFEKDQLGLKVAFDPAARDEALKSVREATSGLSRAIRPCIIAHSFGTYLTARLLHEKEIRFDRVVFVGSILSCATDWAEIQKGFYRLLNDAAASDWVAGDAAGSLGFWQPEFGSAGRDGFVDSDVCHSVLFEDISCEQCSFSDRYSDAPIHNLKRGRQFAHSTVLEGRGQADQVWLPFLLGLVPGEFTEFIDFVHEAMRELALLWNDQLQALDVTLRENLAVRLNETLNRFLGQQWVWSSWPQEDPQTGWQFLEHRIEAAIEKLGNVALDRDALLTDAAVEMVKVAWKALERLGTTAPSDVGTTNRIDELVTCIDPRSASMVAVQRAVQSLFVPPQGAAGEQA